MTDLVAAAASRIMPGNAVTMTVSALTATAIGYYAYARSGHLFSLSYFSKKNVNETNENKVQRNIVAGLCCIDIHLFVGAYIVTFIYSCHVIVRDFYRLRFIEA